MNSKRIGLIVLLLLIVANIGMNGCFYAKLPGRVASEFDFSGEARSWMPKTTFVIFNIVLSILVPLFLLFFAWISTKLPKWMVDLPNRDYWLAPERKPETNARLFRSILWLANGIELFLILLLGLTSWANLGYPNAMRTGPYVLLGGFLLFIAVWLVRFYRQFKEVSEV